MSSKQSFAIPALAAAVLLAHPALVPVAQAQSWTFLVTDGAGHQHYWSPAGRSPDNPAWRRVNHRVDLATPQVIEGFAIHSFHYVVDFDCQGSRYREAAFTIYNQRGLTGQAISPAPRNQWQQVRPGSVTSALQPVACAG